MDARTTLAALLMVTICLVVSQTVSAVVDCNGDFHDDRAVKNDILHTKLKELTGSKLVFDDERKYIGMGTKMSHINKHLAKLPYWSNNGKYMDELKRWQTKRLVPLSDQTRADVSRIIEAYDISTSPRCSADEIDKLNSLDESLDRKASRLNPKYYCVRPIEELVHAILVRYTKECRDSFRQSLQKAYVGVDESVRVTALSLALSLAIHGFARNVEHLDSAGVWIGGADQLKSLKDDGSLAGLIATIKKFAKPEEIPAKEQAVSVDTAKDLLQRYVIDGCQRFVDSTGEAAEKNLFSIQAARYELDWMEQDLSRAVSAWAVCKLAIRERDELAAELSNNWTKLTEQLEDSWKSARWKPILHSPTPRNLEH